MNIETVLKLEPSLESCAPVLLGTLDVVSVKQELIHFLTVHL
jgi:hypothetical protein